jgi:dephospho-CoA kinase
MRIWGITGGIGSGKSFVLRQLELKGYPVLDADVVARQIVDPSQESSFPVLQKIRETIGEEAFLEDASLNRSYLRQWMTQDPQNRSILESLTHPAIREKIMSWVDQQKKTSAQALGFIEASRMIESGLYKKLDGLLWVQASQEKRLERALQRDERSTEAEIKALMKMQLDDSQFQEKADLVLENNSSESDLLTRLEFLIPKMLLLFFLIFGGVSSAWAVEAQEWFPSAKARSWGMAMTAFVDDHNSLHINPAGLALVQERKLRFPDLLMGSISTSFADVLKKFRDLDSNASDTVAQQLQSLDGTAAGFEFSLLSAYWIKHRLGISVTPFGLTASTRIRTPSLLFAKVDLYAAAQGGVTLGYAHPIIADHLRVGVSLRPFAYRIGIAAELENDTIPQVSENLADYSGAGWGVDFDLGVQGNLSPYSIGTDAQLDLMAGLVLQNTLASTYSFPIFSGIGGRPPANQRRINLGVAARLRNSGVLQPTLSLEARDMLSSYEEFLEFLHLGFELQIKPRDFYTSALRLHFAKGNIGGGMGYQWKFIDIEAGTYAVNLGPGAGIARDRRYYIQAALEF